VPFPVERVCAIDWDRGDTVFLLTANESSAVFLSYSLSGNTWQELAQPANAEPGAILAVKPGGTEVLLLNPGPGPAELSRYDRSTGTWAGSEVAPWPIEEGAAFCYADSFAYCLTGDVLTPMSWFWSYDTRELVDRLLAGHGVAGMSQGLSALKLDAYPNPFSHQVSVCWQMPCAGNLTLHVYDIAGRQVRSLFSGRCMSGRHVVSWDGATDSGKRLAAGVYILRLDSQGRSLTRKLIIE